MIWEYHVRFWRAASVKNIVADFNYSNFIYKLKKAQIIYDRKLMAQLAIYDWYFFKYLMQSIN